MKFQIPANVTRGMHRAALTVKKHSPTILAVGGAIGVGVGFVMGCKATTKLNPILEETKRNIDAVHTAVETGVAHTMDPETQEIVPVEYTEEDSKKDLTIYYAKGCLKVAKLYAPAVAVTAVSVACMVASSRILHKRNLALAAAYKAVNDSFKDYRGRVIERFGDELDRELKYGVKAIEVAEEVVDPETGETTTVTKTVETYDPNHRSPYTFIFDETCKYFERDAQLNKMRLIQVQNYLNERLPRVGDIFLNEVLDELGIPRVRIGNVVGWHWTKDNPVTISFGLDKLHNEDVRRFMNGYEKAVWLEMNCEDNILELLP